MSKAKPYFCRKTKGVNADLERHANTERELRQHIARYDDIIHAGSVDYMDYVALTTYVDLLNKLLDSKAEVVDTIGRQKK